MLENPNRYRPKPYLGLNLYSLRERLFPFGRAPRFVTRRSILVFGLICFAVGSGVSLRTVELSREQDQTERDQQRMREAMSHVRLLGESVRGALTAIEAQARAHLAVGSGIAAEVLPASDLLHWALLAKTQAHSGHSRTAFPPYRVVRVARNPEWNGDLSTVATEGGESLAQAGARSGLKTFEDHYLDSMLRAIAAEGASRAATLPDSSVTSKISGSPNWVSTFRVRRDLTPNAQVPFGRVGDPGVDRKMNGGVGRAEWLAHFFWRSQLLVLIDPQKTYSVIRNAGRFSQNGALQTYLVSEDGTLLAHSRSEFIGKNIAESALYRQGLRRVIQGEATRGAGEFESESSFAITGSRASASNGEAPAQVLIGAAYEAVPELHAAIVVEHRQGFGGALIGNEGVRQEQRFSLKAWLRVLAALFAGLSIVGLAWIAFFSRHEFHEFKAEKEAQKEPEKEHERKPEKIWGETSLSISDGISGPSPERFQKSNRAFAQERQIGVDPGDVRMEAEAFSRLASNTFSSPALVFEVPRAAPQLRNSRVAHLISASGFKNESLGGTVNGEMALSPGGLDHWTPVQGPRWEATEFENVDLSDNASIRNWVYSHWKDRPWRALGFGRQKELEHILLLLGPNTPATVSNEAASQTEAEWLSQTREVDSARWRVLYDQAVRL